MHPTIPVHMPLVFDIIDRWKHRSIGRCIYHAVPPGGQIYTTRPVDATEAAERRKARFEKADPTLGPMAIPEEETNLIFPTTLDLRIPASEQGHQGERPGLVP